MISRDRLKKYNDLKAAAEQARKPFDRDAWLNVAFYLNQQYTEWHTESNSIRTIPRLSKKDRTPRPVVNKIMAYVRDAHASALQDKPQGDVLPATDDWGDVADAEVAKAYIDHVADATVANYDRQLASATLWALLTPSGFLKWTWNPILKRADITPVPFFELYLDPYARDWGKLRYIIHSQFMDIEQVYEAWGIELDPKHTESVDTTRSAMLRGMGSAPAVAGVTVNELWMKPCRRYPNGHYVVWTGSTVLQAPTDLPYKHCREERSLPFTQLGTIERPDSIYFQSPVTYLRPAQMELNQAHAQAIAIRKAFSNPKWFLDAELDLEADPDDSPNQILRGSGGPGNKVPMLIQPTSYPPNTDTAMLEQSMMHIVGQHEVSQAQVPGRVESAKAIELLKESDAGALATLRDTIAVSNTQGWFHVLSLAREYETADKIVATYSREGLPEVKHFRAGKLNAGFRIKTTMTTGLARSRTAKQDALFRLIELGVMDDKEQIADQLEIPLNHISPYRARDAKLARNENIQMLQDIAITANSWDEHALHIREHNQMRKTFDYVKATQDVKNKIEYHVEGHEKLQAAAMQTQMAQMQQAQALSGGAAPDGAGPPAPAPETAPPEGEPGTV